MKNFTRLISTLFLGLLSYFSVSAQCPFAGSLYGTIAAPTTCNPAFANPGCHFASSSGGDYASFTALVAGSTYAIRTSATSGSIVSNTDELTVYESTNTVTGSHVAYGTGGTVTFTPTTSGTYFLVINKAAAACGTAESACRYPSIQCTSCAAPGTPLCTTNTAPVNNATNVSLTPTLTWATATNATSYDVYLGTSVASATLLGNSPGTSVILTAGAGLVPNTQYFWYIVPKACDGTSPSGCDATNATNFTTQSPPPANDNCTGALPFSVSPTGACSYTNISSANATLSSQTNACTSTGNNDDIWYTFTPAVSTTFTLRFQTMVAVTGTATNLGYGLFTGTCPGLTAVTGGCSTSFGSAGSGSVITPALTAGTAYYLRVFAGGISNSASWDMCLEENPLPLSNDICNAPTITVGSTGITFSTGGATIQTGEAASCTPPSSTAAPARGNANWNVNSPSISTTVWAKFVAPASGNVEILAATSGDTQMGLFKGAPSGCPTPNFSGMSHVQSNDDDIAASSGFQSRIRARLNPGETYYILVDGYLAGTPSGTCTVTEMATVTQNDGIGDIYVATPVQPGNYEMTSEHPSDQGWSYYYYNNGTTTNLADDKVVLAINKGTNNLGVYAVSATSSPSFSTTTFNVWSGKSAAGASTLSAAPYVTSGISWAMMNSFWNVVPQTQPSTPVQVRHYYTDADFASLQTITTAFSPSVPLANKADMVQLKFNKTTGHWNNTDLNPTGGHTALTSANGTISLIASGSWTNTVLPSGVNQAEFSVSTFSGGGIGAGTGLLSGPLPIELKSFTGKALKSSNMLEWITATEEGVRTHVIERSVDGYSNWTVVGSTPSKGDARIDQSYSMEDLQPLTKGFYRLRTVDLDSREQFSNVISLTRVSNDFGVIAAYPNPATDALNVQFNVVEEGSVTANVTDMMGRLVVQQQMETAKGQNSLTLQLGTVAAGTYFVTLTNSNETTAPVRFVVKK